MQESTTSQMGLFDLTPPSESSTKTSRQKHKKVATTQTTPPKSASKRLPEKTDATAAQKSRSTPRTSPPSSRKGRSGLVPPGDVRLTANIKEEIHLKLKIIAAHERTTIGEIIEELVENYLESPYVIKK